MKKQIKQLLPNSVTKLVAPYGHLVESALIQTKAGFPARAMQVIGVTGTDGKTTTCSLIAATLRSSGRKVAMITTATIDYGDGRGEQTNPTHLTTASVSQLTKILSQIKKNEVEWLVLEVSSHALDQRRIWGIPISIAVMTNMSPEHLDYHGTFENYRKAKERLFKLCNANKSGLQVGIINADDATALYFASHIKHPVTYGLKNGDARAKNPKVTLDGLSYQLELGGENYNISSQLVGEFNIFNTLAAVLATKAAGLDKSLIEQGIASLQSVPGRMMSIEKGQKFKVLIDYAVTPAALENVLHTVRSMTSSGKIHIVFGATGDRDKAKRPVMGKVTSELADFVYLTDDETYTEDGDSIRKSVYSGVAKTNKSKVTVISDRGEAIKTALSNAKSGDTVIITGIGHQTTRNMGGKKQKWSDIETVKTILVQLVSN
jgi:UDP-N-acetylmuramyl-tripeptide synthetase